MSSTDLLDIRIIYVGSGYAVWPMFAPHHYLSQTYQGHRAFLGVLPDGTAVGFTSFRSQPSGHFARGEREHRTVVLPDFQGMGIGARLGDWLGQHVLDRGGRFYSRTAHPRLAAYRNSSPLWVETSSSRKAMTGAATDRPVPGTRNAFRKPQAVERVCFSHRYVGGPAMP